jgi:hypothetical protein
MQPNKKMYAIPTSMYVYIYIYMYDYIRMCVCMHEQVYMYLSFWRNNFNYEHSKVAPFSLFLRRLCLRVGLHALNGCFRVYVLMSYQLHNNYGNNVQRLHNFISLFLGLDRYIERDWICCQFSVECETNGNWRSLVKQQASAVLFQSWQTGKGFWFIKCTL